MKENKRRNAQMKAKAKAEINARVAEKFGFNSQTGKTIKPKNDRYNLYKQQRKEAVKQGIDMIHDDIDELVKTDKDNFIKTNVVRESFKRKVKRHFKEIALGFSIAYTTISLSIFAANKLNEIGDERALDKITSSVSTELETVVEDATKEIDGKISDIDYDAIAEHIQNSSNPDFELFTLYRNYDRENGDGKKEYSDLAEKVCKKLIVTKDYDDKEVNITFKQYVSGDYYGNQTKYELYDRYYEDCKRELLYGDDLKLDQLPYEVKKLTLTNAKETN